MRPPLSSLDGQRFDVVVIGAGVNGASAAQHASAAGIPCASHDDADAKTRDWFHARAVRLCEFPVDEAVARRTQAHGDSVILGAPNVVRKASHCKRLCATTAKGFGDILTSDYYYPPLLSAVFLLMSRIGQRDR